MTVVFSEFGVEKVVQEFLRFKKILDDNKIPFFLHGGTCLGIVRDGALIPHDKDIDIGIMGNENLVRLYAILSDQYDDVHFVDSPVRGRTLWVKRVFDEKNILPFEIQAFYAFDGKVFYNRDLGPTMFFKEVRCVWPDSMFREFGTVEAYGEKWRVPAPVDDFLSTFYGPDWKTPKKYSDWRYNCFNMTDGYWMTEKRIMVIGGSRGIGGLLTDAFAEVGFMCACARNQDEVDTIRRYGAKVDVRDANAIEAFVRKSVEKFDLLDVVIFNAGLMQYDTILAIDPAGMKEMYDVMVQGYLNVLRAVIPVFERRKSGYVINISSTRAVTGAPTKGAYSAMKHAALALTETLEKEYEKSGIKTTNLCLGLVDTLSSRIRYGNEIFRMKLVSEKDVLKTVRWLISLDPDAKPKQVILGGML